MTPTDQNRGPFYVQWNHNQGAFHIGRTKDLTDDLQRFARGVKLEWVTLGAFATYEEASKLIDACREHLARMAAAN